MTMTYEYVFKLHPFQLTDRFLIMRIAHCLGLVFIAGFALPATYCRAQSDLVIEQNLGIQTATEFTANEFPHFAPLTAETPETMAASGRPGRLPDSWDAEAISPCECEACLSGSAGNFVEACDCKGHRRRYGYPWCISQQCLSAAPYGDPVAFSRHERPFGSILRSYMGKQIEKGAAVQLALFHYDFYPADSSQRLKLNSHGRDRLLKMARLMSCYPNPLVIEPTSDQELDEQRRQLVTVILQSSNLVPNAHDRVKTMHPRSRGMDGVEAIEAYQNLLINTQTAGSIPLRGIDLGTSSTR